ncbi:MAG: hypothetical protein JWL60_1448 [Gemmatimonadetes bacterium]|jgi:hypothetical protein|nr:hypothetical protein [Gemmatimonadota bacterium]
MKQQAVFARRIVVTRPGVLLVLAVALSSPLAAHAQGPERETSAAGVRLERSGWRDTAGAGTAGIPAQGSYQVRGMVMGAVLSTAVLAAVMKAECDKKSSSDGPHCMLMIVYLPPALIGGGFVGALIGRGTPR